MNKLIILIVLIFYAASINENISKEAETLFNNSIFRLIVILYLINIVQYDSQLAILVTTCFLLTIHFINKKNLTKLK